METDYLERNKRDFSNLKYINLVYQFFIETFVGIALGYFGGRYLDSLLFEDKQILAIVLLVLGIFSAIVNLIRRVMKKINFEEGNVKNHEEQ